MSTSPLPTEIVEARAQHVSLTEDALVVDLVDGRTITVPLAWYPRLAYGTPAERTHWRLIGEGEGIRWLASRKTGSHAVAPVAGSAGVALDKLTRAGARHRFYGTSYRVCVMA